VWFVFLEFGDSRGDKEMGIKKNKIKIILDFCEYIVLEVQTIIVVSSAIYLAQI
jgi:hypothetical protein